MNHYVIQYNPILVDIKPIYCARMQMETTLTWHWEDWDCFASSVALSDDAAEVLLLPMPQTELSNFLNRHTEFCAMQVEQTTQTVLLPASTARL